MTSSSSRLIDLTSLEGGGAAGDRASGGPLHDSSNTTRASAAGGDDAAAPVRKKRKASRPKSDGERCSICLDEWTSKGKHRICTLLCGHLFGKSCIERWLKERRSCPQCGAKVGAKGSNRVIPLFVQNVVAKDTGELESVRTFLDEEKRLRKQCEAERVRLSIENASLKDQLSRQSTSSTGRNPNLSPGGGGGGSGSGYAFRFLPPLKMENSIPSSRTCVFRAGAGVGSPSVMAGNQRQRQGAGPPWSLSSVSPSPSPGHLMMEGGGGGGGTASSPLPSCSTRPTQDPPQGEGLPALRPGRSSNSSVPPNQASSSTPTSTPTQAPFRAPGPGGVTSTIAPRPASSSPSTPGCAPLLSSSGAAGDLDHRSNSSSSSSAPPRQTSSPTQRESQMESPLMSPSPGSGFADRRTSDDPCPSAPSAADVGRLRTMPIMPSDPKNAGSATCAVVAPAPTATSLGAAAYSQHDPSPGDFRSGSGRSCSSGGGSAGTAAAAAASSREARVAVRSERLLSRKVQAGRVVAFSGEAAGALLVSQEFGERRPQHGITKFSLADLRHHKNIHLHREQIRDIKFSAEGGNVSYILSTGFDKTLKVCDLRMDSVVVSFGLEGNGWSCQWSATNPSQMFCGVVDGTRTSAVQLFDLRSTAGAIRKLRAAARQRQPIHSICHTADDVLLSATMGGVWAWGGGTNGAGGAGGEEQAERLQIQAGPCCSLSQKTRTTAGVSSSSGGGGSGVAGQDRFLVSTRGSSASHAVFGLEAPRALSAAEANAAAARSGNEAGNGGVSAEEGVFGGQGCQEEHCHLAGGNEAGPREDPLDSDGRKIGQGASGAGVGVAAAEHRSWSKRWTRFPGAMQGHQSQQTLSRSLLMEGGPSPGAGLLVAGGDERTNQPWIWDASSGDVCHRLGAHRSPVLDVAALRVHAGSAGLFAAVSQGEISVYQTHVYPR